MSDRSSPLRRMWASQRPYRLQLATASLMGAAALICAIALLGVSGWLISRASQMPPVFTLSVAIVAVRAFGIGRGFFRYLERLISHDAAFRGLTSIRRSIWTRLETLAPQGVAEFRRGDLLSRMVADVDAVQDLTLRVVLPATVALLAGSASVVVTWWLLPTAGLVLLCALILGATVVPWLTVHAGGRAERQLAPFRGELSAQVGELLRGSADLLATGASLDAISAIELVDEDAATLARRSALTAGIASALSVTISGLAVLGALIAGLGAVVDGRLSGVNLAVVVLLPLAAYESVTALPSAASALIRVRSSADRLVQVVDAPNPVAEPRVPQPLSEGDVDIELRGVRAGWGPAGPEVLHGVDLSLQAGRRVAVVGSSGVGKSTLVSVLVRFVDYHGSATLGGIELSELNGDKVRSVIGLCAQDAHVFNSTIGENVRLGRGTATDDEIIDVLTRVGLTAFVSALPAGIHTAVGEHGSQLSGGQRRRLILARSLLANPRVLILDEPTEHLDAPAARAFMSTALDLTRDRTTLIVTHRLSGLETLDEIIVLEGGRVVERGTHHELLAARGVYANRFHTEQELEVVD